MKNYVIPFLIMSFFAISSCNEEEPIVDSSEFLREAENRFNTNSELLFLALEDFTQAVDIDSMAKLRSEYTNEDEYIYKLKDVIISSFDKTLENNKDNMSLNNLVIHNDTEVDDIFNQIELFTNPNNSALIDLLSNRVEEYLKTKTSIENWVISDSKPGISAEIASMFMISNSNMNNALSLGSSIAASSSDAETGIIEQFEVQNNFSHLATALLLPAVQSYTFSETSSSSYTRWVGEVFVSNPNLEAFYKELYVAGYYVSIDFMTGAYYKHDNVDNASVGIYKERFVGMLLAAGHQYWLDSQL